MTASDTGAPAPRPQRRRLKLILLALLIVPLLGFAFYTWSTLNFNYSDGSRAGVLQKFSRKGWVCKTYEGELAQSIVAGVSPTIWQFSVREDGVARKLNEAVGKKVSLHYTEHRGVPTSCFSTTNYFVDSVRVIE